MDGSDDMICRVAVGLFANCVRDVAEMRWCSIDHPIVLVPLDYDGDFIGTLSQRRNGP